jgi:hypothetical protein
MNGIDRHIFFDQRHIGKHLPGTPQVQRLLKRGLSAHVFNNRVTMEKVTRTIIQQGEFIGLIRGYERYGLYFTEAIGYRITPQNDSTIPLFYGELKINVENKYHVIPRTRPSQA